MARETDDNFYNSVGGQAAYEVAEEAINEQDRIQQQEKWKLELTKLEEEIGTLRSVLSAKMNEASELKRKLGITPIGEIKEDILYGIQVIRESETVQKTNERLQQLSESITASDAYQKTNTAFKSFGEYASKKMGDLRNSNAFKSVEGKVGDAYSSMKRQINGSRSTDDYFGDVPLRATASKRHDV